MSKRRRMEITVETTRVVLRHTRRTIFCPTCFTPTPMITQHEAAVLAGVSTRTIEAMAAAAQLHFIEMEMGRLLICPQSLLNQIKGEL